MKLCSSGTHTEKLIKDIRRGIIYRRHDGSPDTELADHFSKAQEGIKFDLSAVPDAQYTSPPVNYKLIKELELLLSKAKDALI